MKRRLACCCCCCAADVPDAYGAADDRCAVCAAPCSCRGLRKVHTGSSILSSEAFTARASWGWRFDNELLLVVSRQTWCRGWDTLLCCSSTLPARMLTVSYVVWHGKRVAGQADYTSDATSSSRHGHMLKCIYMGRLPAPVAFNFSMQVLLACASKIQAQAQNHTVQVAHRLRNSSAPGMRHGSC